MRRLFAYVIDHRKRTIATFVVLSVLLAACIPFVRVNPSLSDYLPSTSRSTISLDKMGEIYGDDLANIRVYVQGISESDAGELADSLSDTEHVSNLNWLGSKLDLMMPLDLQGTRTQSSRGTLMAVTFTPPTSRPATRRAYRRSCAPSPRRHRVRPGWR